MSGIFTETNTKSFWTPCGNLLFNLAKYSTDTTIDIYEGGFTNAMRTYFDKIVSLGSDARSETNLLVIDNEIMAFNSLLRLPNGNWRILDLRRAVCDTVKDNHGQQSLVWFLDINFLSNVAGRTYTVKKGLTSTESLNITTSNPNEKEKFDYNKVKIITTRRRSEAPSIPGNFRWGYYVGPYTAYYEDYSFLDYAGDFICNFYPRNKFQATSIIFQTDTEDFNTKAKFVPDKDTKYVIQVTIGNKTVKKYYDAIDLQDDGLGLGTFISVPITELKYTWAERCLDFPNTGDQNTTIEIYASNNGLDSYSRYVNNFNWQVPTIVCLSKVEDLMSNYTVMVTDNNSVKVLETNYNHAFTVYMRSAPIFLEGIEVSGKDDDTVFSNTGKYYKLTGKAVIAVDVGKPYFFDLQPGYIFKTRFTEDKSIIPRYYQWDGTKVSEINYVEGV